MQAIIGSSVPVLCSKWSKHFQKACPALVQLCRHMGTKSERKRLVILGTGWGSYSVLKSIDKTKFDVIVVSPRNHFLFTPLLCSTTVGTLEFRSIIEPVRETRFRHSDHFHLAYARGLNIGEKTLDCQSTIRDDVTFKLPYDKLVIGVGALSNTFGVPGVEEHACFLKELSDARRIRDKILSNFELSVSPGITEEESRRLLQTVIVGGGPTGVEFGAELYDFVKEDVTKLYPKMSENVHVTLVESNTILGNFDQRLQAYAEKKIRARKRFHLVKSSVSAVNSNHVVLKDGTVLPCGLVVWSTGLAPRPFTKKLDMPKNDAGQLLTDNRLCVVGDPSGDVFAIGDCADIEGFNLPCTAHVAERQGRFLANQLSKNTDEPFVYKSLGMMAYIGGYSALTEVPKVKLRGFHSWLLWRSAYLTRLGSWRLRMQVPIDWLKTLLYGRDVSKF
ncbi:probable NADH dehydrogenase [Lineus longissimus]|uniref:probable NADH dehydrogenase n=1 Tax=Lineus longissimus TaxID=88925 RepID=UPI002B4E67F1